MATSIRNSVIRRWGLLLLMLCLGGAGGVLIGFVVLAFGSYIGRSGSTGTEYFGYWNPQDHWWMARHFGALVGAVMLPFGYFRYLRDVAFGRALILPALATLAGGLVGAVIAPGIAAMGGCIAFLFACRRVGSRAVPGADGNSVSPPSG